MTGTPPEGPRRVAIACQGGGSHTAFTAGVLSRLLDGGVLDGGVPDGDELDGGYEIVGLSGTSGGAVCALLACAAFLVLVWAVKSTCWRRRNARPA